MALRRITPVVVSSMLPRIWSAILGYFAEIAETNRNRHPWSRPVNARSPRLNVYDSEKVQIGVVVAKTVFDVVSYVDPVEDGGQYENDIYQVVLE